MFHLIDNNNDELKEYLAKRGRQMIVLLAILATIIVLSPALYFHRHAHAKLWILIVIHIPIITGFWLWAGRILEKPAIEVSQYRLFAGTVWAMGTAWWCFMMFRM